MENTFELNWDRLRRALQEVNEATAAIERSIPEIGARYKVQPAKGDLVAEILASGPLEVHQIVSELSRRGYKFRTRDPIGSTRSMLYRDPRFRCEGAVFSLATPPTPDAPAAGPDKQVNDVPE